MSRNNRRFIHGTCVEICFRAQTGLPLPPTPYIRTLLIGIMAFAQLLFPVVIVGFVVMSNHVHLILKVVDPADVPRFVGYLKRELAHAINRLLGRCQVTVWEESYDAPVIGSPEALINRLVYLYTNPQSEDLIDTIEEYPNLSSWGACQSGKDTVVLAGKKIGRDYIEPLYRRDMTAQQQSHFNDHLLAQPGKDVELVVSPNAWMECFPETFGQDPAPYADEIRKRVKEKEATLRAARKTPCVGTKKLIAQPFNTTFLPKKRGRRMLILDVCRRRRAAYIAQHKDYQKVARQVRKDLPGASPLALPPGFFLAGGLSLASVLLWATPLAYAFGP